MSTVAALRRTMVQARVRVALDTLAVALPLALGAGVLAWRLGGAAFAVAVAGLAVLGGVAAIAWRGRRFDRAWLVSRLDATRRDLEDSTGLLFAEAAQLRPLQRLQRARLVERLRARVLPDLRPAWSKRTLLLAWSFGAAVVALALLWPSARPPAADSAGPGAPPAVPGEPRRIEATLEVRPPAYTGIDASRSASLDARAPAGSTLRWTLRYAPQPEAVDLVFHDGRRLPLQRDGETWTATERLQGSTLYRVVPLGVTGADRSSLHRLDAVPDQPPRVRVLAPERSLTLLTDPAAPWTLRFEGLDDHGVAAQARLRITRTEGTGENIRFHDHVRVLAGRGARRERRFETRLRPADFGLQRGEDLVARLEVLDNRSPQPQLARSASVILRWPPEPVLGADGLDGLARQVLPAYFRSQRQIIIDAEALLKERPRLEAEEFERRSDAIGVDQRLLRLRYGQFLGEESEGGRALPTSDLPTSDLPTSDLPAAGGAGAADDHPHDARHDGDHEDGHAHEPADDQGDAAGATPAAPPHDHDHADGPGAAPAAGFGDAGDVLETFGHTHDIPEAATLLDPQTRETLRAALREMWQSELHLRQAVPADALPYAYRALELIKQVQQADRIYLQRVGSQLPPIDPSRRLGGKREGIADRALPPLQAMDDDAPLAAVWQALDRADADAVNTSLDALQAWVDDHRDRLDDPLAWLARIEEARQDPGCDDCRAALRGLLWSGMPRPAGGIGRRAGDGTVERRYLDALEQEDAP
ncbi:hypothetical protein [Luteimonas kalidii]|uniref:DUF4175 domain-containing protein n=1 Tax=Luteimonas kalidii TaxID=3042025 RepID=A0ABT6JPI7_9GAMM|nr:hypothetical protein [Luteimonas kalidii]MDH5832562.1 hypothetical protein [Luteimonas kalidii]